MPGWIKFKADKWPYEAIAERICDMVYGRSFRVFHQEDRDSWQIGGPNNLWLHRRPDPDDPENPYYELHFRYGMEERTAWVAAAIKDQIQRYGGEFIEVR